MKNPLGYLGFLGLLGILSFISHNWNFLWFFCFFIFFRFSRIIPDELFRENIKKSATPAFFTGMVIDIITAATRAFPISMNIYVLGLVIGFASSILVFTVLFAIYSYRESRG
jgi:hypothetical protein